MSPRTTKIARIAAIPVATTPTSATELLRLMWSSELLPWKAALVAA